MTANNITIAGNLTRDPELRFTPSGKATARFSVAVNQNWNGPDGERKDSVSYFDVVVWGKPAEHVSQSLTKGQEVLVAGRRAQRSWETPDNERRHKVEITATRVAAGLTFGSAVFTKASGASNGSSPDDYAEEPF
jgi:single-strand DNA-binding protein